MTPPGKISKKTFAFLLTVFFVFSGMPLNAAEPAVQYEYKLVRLGSLSSLQKDDAAAKQSEVEKTLNKAGLDGWEMVSIFAVRTTFDPNVFFAVMKRPIPDRVKEGEAQ
jgi:hypothetical protein